jgi:hypothetical protein
MEDFGFFIGKPGHSVCGGRTTGSKRPSTFRSFKSYGFTFGSAWCWKITTASLFYILISELWRLANPKDVSSGQGQHLKLPAIKGNEFFLDEPVSGFDVVINGKLQKLADAVVAIEAQSVTVGSQHQKEIQQSLL